MPRLLQLQVLQALQQGRRHLQRLQKEVVTPMRKSLVRWLTLAASVVAVPLGANAQANGKLQIHFMDVGQGDGAILVSPRGETVLFDDGVLNNCDKPVSYLQQLGITEITYHITSHYHSDHIGCAPQVFAEFPLKKDALDRGFSYASSAYQNYVAAVGSHRKTATAGMSVTLDQGSPNPVKIDIAAVNGNGVPTDNENDLSLVAVVHFGDFDAVIGGDLSGVETDNYKDIESTVIPKVGRVEVYKVHHHCSAYSSNAAWLAAIKPLVGIVSAGGSNTYGHPTAECLSRLHAEEIRTYWTSQGRGGQPTPGFDTIAGNVVVEAEPGGKAFSVSYGARRDDYLSWNSGAGGVVSGSPAPTAATYSWSKRSKVYHYATCTFVANISAANFESGSAPPASKTLHQGCPR